MIEGIRLVSHGGEVEPVRRTDRAAGGAVARLEREGRLRRRTDPGDRRRAVLAPSAAGRGVYRRLIPTVRAYESALVAALTADETAQLGRMLSRLYSNVRRRYR